VRFIQFFPKLVLVGEILLKLLPISRNLLWGYVFLFECFKEPFLAGIVLRSSVVVVEVRCNRSYAVDDLPRFEPFQGHLRRHTPRAIVILASQPRPLAGLDASHS
jgi:hypothetical protein